VGQGLAGSLLAWQLLRRGRRVLVVDDRHRGSSSMVAAGLINPVTGMRLVLNPQAGPYLSEALRCYRDLSHQFRRPFFHPRPMWRLFAAEAERERCRQRRLDPAYRGWLDDEFPAFASPEGVLAPEGGCRIRHTGYVDLPGLLKSVGDWLSAEGALLRDRVRPEDCLSEGDRVRWKEHKAVKMIWCEGHQARHNPLSDWLPFQVVKGEILNLSGPKVNRRHIVNRGRWLLHTDSGRWRLGASYDRDDPDLETTSAARESLLHSLRTMVPDPQAFNVGRQQAGIRPATLDTQPFVGLLPGRPRIGLFNGFGSKGSLMIPWHAKRFADFLDGRAELPAWADPARYSGRLNR
jgi:glycine oxidase